MSQTSMKFLTIAYLGKLFIAVTLTARFVTVATPLKCKKVTKYWNMKDYEYRYVLFKK